MFASIFSLAFFGFLENRISSLIWISDHTLEIDAICIDYLQNIINVAINSSKTDQCGKKNWQIQKILKKNHLPNIELYLKMHSKIKRLLFINLNHRGISRFQACSILKSALRCAWYNPWQYNTHYFIIVAAATALILGKTADQIKQMCRWKSNTFQKYIRLGFYIKYQKHF